MKSFLCLFFFTLSLGTSLSLSFISESIFYIPLYLVSLYLLYRINMGEAFFMVFHELGNHTEAPKIRLGPTEMEVKGDLKKEDRFMDLFDWRKSKSRSILSVIVSLAMVTLLFAKLGISLSLVSFMPVISCFYLIRAITVGHLLIPLGINLVCVIFAIRNLTIAFLPAGLIYGFLFVLTLTLVYPSFEQNQRKLSNWQKGKLGGVFRTFAILLVSFTLGYILFKDLDSGKDPLEQTHPKGSHIRNIQQKKAALDAMERIGLIEKTGLSGKFSNLLENQDGKRLELRKRELDEEFTNLLQSAPVPRLTPELLEYMKRDLNSRNTERMNPDLARKVIDLAQQIENYQGIGSDDLVREYRDLKFGDGGFFRKETEYSDGPAEAAGKEALNELINSPEIKKELREKLDKNIETLRTQTDQSLFYENAEIKKKLSDIDQLTAQDQKKLSEALKRNEILHDTLAKRISDPEWQKKLADVGEENERLRKNLIESMNAQEKSQFAQKIRAQEESLQKLKKDIRQSVEEDLARKELQENKTEPKITMDWKKAGKKLIFLIVAMAVIWFFNQMNKKGVKKARVMPDEIKNEIEAALSVLKKKKLSPREEVIESYNILHNAFGKLVLNRETPPSCILNDELGQVDPDLYTPAFTVTDTFARTLYGDKEVTPPVLKVFRKDIKRILSFFDVYA